MKHVSVLSVVVLLAISMPALAEVKRFMPPQNDAPDSIEAKWYVQQEESAPPRIKSLLKQFRKEISDQGLDYSIGYTSVIDTPIDKLTGLINDPTLTPQKMRQVNEKAATILKAKGEKTLSSHQQSISTLSDLKTILQKENGKNDICSPNMGSFNWQNVGKVTAIKNQQECGSCWAFAATAAFESSFLIRNNLAIDASEQYVLDCNVNAGSCDGGDVGRAFKFITETGHTNGPNVPYLGQKQACNNPPKTLKADTWGFATNHKGNTVQELKAALCTYGPLVVTMYIPDNSKFTAYTGGVFNEKIANESALNHAIVLVGFDDSKQAWRIKNSWSTKWGESGYAWIGYTSSNVGFLGWWIKASEQSMK